MTVNSEEEISYDFCLDMVQEFILWLLLFGTVGLYVYFDPP
jgi:hypothetical protein